MSTQTLRKILCDVKYFYHGCTPDAPDEVSCPDEVYQSVPAVIVSQFIDDYDSQRATLYMLQEQIATIRRRRGRRRARGRPRPSN